MAFTGRIVKIQFGEAGLAGTHAPRSHGSQHLSAANNCQFAKGYISKEGGTSLYTPVALGAFSIMGGHDWWPSGTLQRSIIVTTAGTILRDTGAGTYPVTMAAGLTITSDVIARFVDTGKESAGVNRKLLIFTGLNPVRVIDGDAVVANVIATPPADWAGTNQPTVGIVHEGRVWGAGNANDPHRVYYSTTSNVEDFTGAGSGSISLFPGVGDKIVDMMSLKGGIIVLKYPRGTYWVNTSSTTASDWKATSIAAAIGGCSNKCMAQTEDDILFMDCQGGIHSVKTVQEFGEIGMGSVSDTEYIINYIRNNVNLGSLSKVHSLYYPAKRELHFAVPAVGSTICNMRIVLDFNEPERFENGARYRTSDRDTITSMWRRVNGSNILRPSYGDNTGKVRDMDKSTLAHDGAGYSCFAQTVDMDLGDIDPELAFVRKNWRYIEIEGEPASAGSIIQATIILDGDRTYTTSFSMGASGATLGTFRLGTDASDSDVLAAEGTTLRSRRRLPGASRRIQIALTNTTLGQDMAIYCINLYFQVAGLENEP